MLIQQNPGWAEALGGIIGAVGNYVQGKSQAQQAKADAQQKAQAQAAAQALAQQKVGIEQQNADTQQQEALTRAKQEASTELHQRATEALADAQLQLKQNHDAMAFQQAQQKINQEFALGVGKINASVTVAQVHAQASVAQAQIHAAATVQSAQIHAAATERGQDMRAAKKADPAANLTPQGQQFLRMLESTNNPADPRAAAAALAQSQLPESDKTIIRTMLAGKQKPLLTGKPPRKQAGVVRTQNIGALPGTLQALIIKMRTQGVTDTGINKMIQPCAAGWRREEGRQPGASRRSVNRGCAGVLAKPSGARSGGALAALAKGSTVAPRCAQNGSKKGVGKIAQALDAQRFAVAQKAGLGNTTDEQMTNLRTKLGIEKDYQDNKLFGLIPQPQPLHHFEQGLVDAALGTLTDPLTLETLGAGPLLKVAARAAAGTEMGARAGAAASKAITQAKALPSPLRTATRKGVGSMGEEVVHGGEAIPWYDLFTYGGKAKRVHGVETVENVLGTKGRVLTQGDARKALYNRTLDQALHGTTEAEQLNVFHWMNGEIPFERLTKTEQAAAKQMDRWRNNLLRVGQVTAPQMVTKRQNWFPGVHPAGEGTEARTVNLLEPFDPHLLQRDVKNVPINSAAEGLAALRGAANSRAGLATGHKLEKAVRETLGTPTGQAIPSEIRDLFDETIRATGNKRDVGQVAADLWRGLINVPKAAVVGTGIGHIANITSLAANQPGGLRAIASAPKTFAQLMAKPGARNQILKDAIEMGAIGRNSERSTAAIDLLNKLPGPLSFPGKVLQLGNKATWAWDDAITQGLAKNFVQQGRYLTPTSAGRAARRALVDYEHLSPFAQASKNVMPFAAFHTSLPKAVAGGIARNPARAAFLSRATGGAMYGSDYDLPGVGTTRSYLPTADIGRAEPFKYARNGLALPVAAPIGAVESAFEHSIGLNPRDFQKNKYGGPPKLPFTTFGQDPLTPQGAKALLLQLLTSPIPYGRQIQQNAGLGTYKPQQLLDILLQSQARQLPLR